MLEMFLIKIMEELDCCTMLKWRSQHLVTQAHAFWDCNDPVEGEALSFLLEE